jgi:hypothetical protein
MCLGSKSPFAFTDVAEMFTDVFICSGLCAYGSWIHGCAASPDVRVHRLPVGEKVELVGVEGQHMTLVMSIKGGV